MRRTFYESKLKEKSISAWPSIKKSYDIKLIRSNTHEEIEALVCYNGKIQRLNCRFIKERLVSYNGKINVPVYSLF